MPARTHWDVFCHVVDNYGDIGVCWRLARQLVAEHGLAVRLWVSDLTSLHALAPGLDPARDRQKLEGVEVCRWDTPFPAVRPAEVVIEAFACEPPPSYVEAMARQQPAPLWINLEYLSAEPWVDSHHGLPSPHPRLPLTKYFFFPGFGPDSGGLIREAGLLERRDAFRRNGGAAAFWHALGAIPSADALTVSLFGYPNPALEALLAAWQEHPRPIFCVLPQTPLADQVAELLHLGPLTAGKQHRAGALTLAAIPFLPQTDYDRLLWSCDLNFVRGEDSLVRALWAGKPLVWHIYPQHDAAHDAKLDAFLARYEATLAPWDARALRAFWHAWNGRGAVREAWSGFADALPALGRHAAAWSAQLAAAPDLAAKLVKFSATKV